MKSCNAQIFMRILSKMINTDRIDPALRSAPGEET
jgi:hypothetical protein